MIPTTKLIGGWDSEIVRELSARAFCRVDSFGIEEGANWRARELEFRGEMTTFTVYAGGRRFSGYRTPLAGLFNVRNCLAVIATCEALGLDRTAVAEALAEFKSVKRVCRTGNRSRGPIIDDFAHHPTAGARRSLRSTKYPADAVALFEPRSYTAQIAPSRNNLRTLLAKPIRSSSQGCFTRAIHCTQRSLQGKWPGVCEASAAKPIIPSVDEIVAHLSPRLQKTRSGCIMSNVRSAGFTTN